MHLDEHSSVEEAYLAGRRRLAATSTRLTAQHAPALLNGRVSLSLSQRPRTATSNMTREEFLGAVQKTKEYIQVRQQGGRQLWAGDCSRPAVLAMAAGACQGRPCRQPASGWTPDLALAPPLLPPRFRQSGDVFQLVLSQRFERRTFADPFEIYR